MFEKYNDVLIALEDINVDLLEEMQDALPGFLKAPYHEFRLLGEAKLLIIEACLLRANTEFPELDLDFDISGYADVIKNDSP